MWPMTNKSDRPFPIRFITVEGGEGAGKTSLLDQIEKFLNDRGVGVVRTREPGGTVFGEHLRSWLLDQHNQFPISSKAELFLFLSARAQHIEEVILPAIKAGKVVLCDRYNDSTIAYQGAGRHLGMEWVANLCSTLCGTVVPDLTFYLDVDPAIGLSRTKHAVKDNAKAGEVDRIEAEKLEFHQQVREAFKQIAKNEPKRFYPIDANQSKINVTKAAINVISSYFQHV